MKNMNADLLQQFMGWILLISLWSLVWKGLALWRAAQLKQKGWFIALLIINTAGILDIIYLLITNDEIKDKGLTKEIEENKN